MLQIKQGDLSLNSIRNIKMPENSFAVVIYLISMLVLAIQIIATTFGFIFIEPLSAIILFLFFQELSKLMLQFNKKKEDG
jgi:hypothetical protein